MADRAQDITDYRDAIENLLLSGEALEAIIPAGDSVLPDSDEPRVIGLTSHRLIICHRRLRSGTSDRWRMRTVVYSSIEEIELGREENLRREQIEASASVLIHYRRPTNGSATRLDLQYRDPVVARELHDRIVSHVFTVAAHGTA